MLTIFAVRPVLKDPILCREKAVCNFPGTLLSTPGDLYVNGFNLRTTELSLFRNFEKETFIPQNGNRWDSVGFMLSYNTKLS